MIAPGFKGLLGIISTIISVIYPLLELTLPADLTANGKNPFADGPTLDEIQRRDIGHILQKTGGRIAGPDGAAEILGMKRTSLYSRMRMLGMAVKKSR
ncbi:MAG: hypothetical protein HY892_00440 [Deltaproteobacteria bacterium]|nr:hypothetical protein [Deltaproteobacteria bacterium]